MGQRAWGKRLKIPKAGLGIEEFRDSGIEGPKFGLSFASYL